VARRIVEIVAIVAMFVAASELVRVVLPSGLGWWGGLTFYALWIPVIALVHVVQPLPPLVPAAETWTVPNAAILVAVVVTVDYIYGFAFARTIVGDRALHAPKTWQYLVNAAIAAPLIEEWLFRGVLWDAIEPRARTIGALAITSLLFGPWHWRSYFAPSWTGSGGTFVLLHSAFGALCGVLRWRFRSIAPGFIVHAIWNALVPLTE
jgi:membrane protease YdiL (CAAX protease family)